MSRPKATIRRISKNLSLPEDIVAHMELELYSDLEGCVPRGAQSELIERLLREHFNKQPAAATELPPGNYHAVVDKVSTLANGTIDVQVTVLAPAEPA